MATPSRSTWLARVVSALLVLASFAVAELSPSSTPANAASVGANGQGTLLFVGDSLTVGSVAFGRLKERIEATNIWTSVVVDAKVGRKASQGADVLKSRIGRRTTAVVIALGVNDMISRPEPWYPTWVINKVMKQTGGRPVLWVNPKFSDTGRRDWVFRANRFARALRTAQTRWPTLTIADWNKTFVPRGPVRFIADGVHLTVSGYRTRATFCARSVAEFGRAVVDSTTTTTTTTTTSPETTVVETVAPS